MKVVVISLTKGFGGVSSGGPLSQVRQNARVGVSRASLELKSVCVGRDEL